MQRHHILPRQVLHKGFFQRMLAAIGRDRLAMDDFRTNGLLLPSLEQAAQVLGLPLHRGPHWRYNGVVIERLGQMEATWHNRQAADPDLAGRELLMRMRLLQQALRRALMRPGMGLARLNRSDPAWHTVDFSELDAMAEMLWTVSEPPTA